MDLELKAKSVLITGSTRGLGYAIAKSFVREGATVILVGRQQENLDKAVADLKSEFPEAHCEKFCGDLQLREEVQSLSEQIIQSVGSLDHMVCNIGDGRSVPSLEVNMEELDRMLTVNLKSAVLCVETFAPLLKASAERFSCTASISLIASICGVEVLGCPVAYATAKSALISYAKNIARPLAKQAIRVNLVSPGNIMFPGSTWESKQQQNPSLVASMLEQQVPLKRFGRVEEIADVVVFLASNRASFVSGANWVVDGGQTHVLY